MAGWKPVTSRDVAFTFRVYTDTLLASNGVSEVADIDSVTAPDSSSATFWFSRRTEHQFYDAASLMLILPKHVYGAVRADSLRAFAARTNPIGSGKYQLVRWNKGSYFELGAVVDHYRGSAHIDRLIWSVTPEYQAAVTQLLGGSADVFDNIRYETLPLLDAARNYNVVSLPGMDYVFMRFNLRDASGSGAPHDLFASRDLRRAVTMAIDRQSLVRNLFDTLGAVGIGPTVRVFPATDTSVTQIPFDTSGAARILDSLGWRLTPAFPVRMRLGKPLRFTVLVPVSSLSRIRIAVMIQEELRRQGIDMKIDQMDINAFNARQEERLFDAALRRLAPGFEPRGRQGNLDEFRGGKGRAQLWRLQKQNVRFAHRQRAQRPNTCIRTQLLSFP